MKVWPVVEGLQGLVVGQSQGGTADLKRSLVEILIQPLGMCRVILELCLVAVDPDVRRSFELDRMMRRRWDLEDGDPMTTDQSGGEFDSRFGRQSGDRKSTRLNSSHVEISYAVFCLKKKKKKKKCIKTKSKNKQQEKS